MSLTRLQASNLLIRSLGLIPLSNDRGDGLAGFAGHDFGLTFLLRILRISYFFSMAMERQNSSIVKFHGRAPQYMNDAWMLSNLSLRRI
jgi:hypothetical protein